jgi:DNA-binding Xre family transcriptional regulator
VSISFAPFWETMKKKNYTTYDLKYRLKISGSTYNRLKNNENISMNSIGMLCDFLECNIEDIVQWEREIDSIGSKAAQETKKKFCARTGRLNV